MHGVNPARACRTHGEEGSIDTCVTALVPGPARAVLRSMVLPDLREHGFTDKGNDPMPFQVGAWGAGCAVWRGTARGCVTS